MATLSGKIRQGLPRVEGGAPWPPARQVPGADFAAPVVDAEPTVDRVTATIAPTAPTVAAALSAPVVATPAGAAQPQTSAAAAVSRQLRRGLPRVLDGDPWPPADAVPVLAPLPADSADAPVVDVPAPATAPPLAASGKLAQGTTPLRRGLPRVTGGEPWPQAGFAPAAAAGDGGAHIDVKPVAEMAQAASMAEGTIAPTPAAAASAEPATYSAEEAAAVPESKPPEDAAAAQKPARPNAEAKLYGSRTLAQWGRFGALVALAAVAAAALLVLAARGVTTLPGVPGFLRNYPGEYHLPDTADPGFPWWAQWAHFMNIFLMVLIIRSGYQVRTQQKPPAFWTPKRGGKKVSINLWLHQSLDLLWLLNGVIFVVLLFVSGHWMRIVPSSWEVFPNALSALLQYMTLDWPVDNGWVNYNSLQQLMYFIVVFIAAPLAALTGVRMSELWPKNAKTLNKIYPVEAARAIHFPTMLFFVLFILIHVFLVFATGALRNLNHMFGGTDLLNWTGFWLFAAAIAVTAAAWFAARPLVLAPIAKLFGQVSRR